MEFERLRREEEPAHDHGEEEAAPSMAAGVLGLQQSAGNAAVSRLLSPSPPNALQRDVPDGGEYMEARRAREAWIAGGVRGPEDYRASTGIGGFRVAYVPEFQAMNATLEGAVDFKDGITLVMGFAIALQPTAPVQAAANAINAAPADQREALVAPWKWTEGEKTQFMTQFQSVVTTAWDRQYEFHSSKKYWEDLGSKVNVFARVHAGAKNDQDHMSIKTYKIATGQAADPVGVVNSGGNSRALPGARNNTMTLNSTDVAPRTDIALTRTASFDPGTDTFSGSGAAVAQGFGGDFVDQGGPRCATCGAELRELAGTTINVRVQGSGADPQTNAHDRFDAITREMAAGGMTNAATRARFEYAGTGDTATMLVGDGAAQVVAAHEAGHMFGLHDEYTNPFGGTGAAPGSAIDGNLGPDQGLPGAISENSDSIMAVGAAVKPQHYATFLEALKHITGMQEWVFGPPQAVLPPGVDGPLPQQPGDRSREPGSALA